MINNPFLFLSAIAYTLPFLAPTYCWWLIFLFPSFLFFALQKNQLRMIDSLLWALAISTFHIVPLGDAVIRMTSAPLVMQLLPTILLIMYVSLYPLCLLIALQKISRSALTFSLALWIYLLLIEYALFWPFGRIEGYVFMNPLLPLTIIPSLLWLLHWISMPAMLLLYCISTSALTRLLLPPVRPECRARSARCIEGSIIPLLLCIVPWFAPSYFITPPPPPAWLAQVGHLPIILPNTMPADRGAMLISHEIEELAKKHPDLQLVVMPESTWNGLPLNEINALPTLKNLPVSHLLIGSFSLENEQHYNSLYWFTGGTRAGRFDKHHAVPFIERIPWGAQRLCNKLFFKKSGPISCAGGPRHQIKIGNDITLVPYICSEIFCNNTPYDPHSKLPILAACNDWNFGLPYFQKLMLMAAQLRAIQWNRPILYISFRYAQYIDQYGSCHPISTTPQDHFLK